MKLVGQFNSEADAYIAKGMLASNGIAATVMPNNIATLYSAGATWAPVELYVADGDAAEAEHLLRKHHDQP